MTANTALPLLQAKLDTITTLTANHGIGDILHLYDLNDTGETRAYILCKPDWIKTPFKPSQNTLTAIAALGTEGWLLGSVVDGWQSVYKPVEGVLVELYQAYPVALPTPQPVDPALLMGGAA